MLSTMFAVSISANPVSAMANLMEEDLLAPGDGLITLDTSTGLRWLDVTATLGLSYNEAEASVYATDHGFRHATYKEVRALKENQGLILDSQYHSNPNAKQLINLMGGYTRLMPWFKEFTGWTDMNNPRTISSKLTTYNGDGYKWDYYMWTSKDYAWSGAGNFLVKESTNTAPDVSDAQASTTTLRPPNKKMVPITVQGVTDADGDAVSITITNINQDEKTGKKADASGVGTSTANVRAERDGKGDGRVYHIFFTADDGNGGVTSGVVNVYIPHDQSGKPAVDGGALYDSTGPS